MAEPDWPSSQEVHAAARPRLERLLEATGGLTAEIGGHAFGVKHGLLSEAPHSLTIVLVAGACQSAGQPWQCALWPAVGAECMMIAADLFDDAADLDPAGTLAQYGSPVLLTTAAGLLSLATTAVLRVSDDGAPASTAVALVGIRASGFAAACNGQALNLQKGANQLDALSAYRQSAAKSGPLGSLIARMGARTASDNPKVV